MIRFKIGAWEVGQKIEQTNRDTFPNFPSEAHATAGRRPAHGAERAERAERAQSAFTKNRVILTLPNTDYDKKNFFTCPKSHHYVMIFNKEYNEKNFFTLKSSPTCGWIFDNF